MGKKCYEEVFELKTLIFEAEIWAKMAKKGKKKIEIQNGVFETEKL